MRVVSVLRERKLLLSATANDARSYYSPNLGAGEVACAVS